MIKILNIYQISAEKEELDMVLLALKFMRFHPQFEDSFIQIDKLTKNLSKILDEPEDEIEAWTECQKNKEGIEMSHDISTINS